MCSLFGQPVDREAQCAVTIACFAAGQRSQYWAGAQREWGFSCFTSTVEPAPHRAGEAIVSAAPRADTRSSLLNFSYVSAGDSNPKPLDGVYITAT